MPFNIMKAAVTAAALTALSVSVFAKAEAAEGEATIIDRNGKTIGSMLIQDTPSGIVRITVSATGISPGWHGVHIHETGACDTADGFKSAGGHLSGSHKHGIMVEGGPHPGDLPNQMVHEGGQLAAEIYGPPSLKLMGEEQASVFDSDGSAFVIHSGRDDYASQPSGDAGERIACGIIEKR